MIKILHNGYNLYDNVELFYDTERKNYIFILNNKKHIIKGVK